MLPGLSLINRRLSRCPLNGDRGRDEALAFFPSIPPPFHSSPLLLHTSPEICSTELFKRDHLDSMYSSSYHSRARLIGYLAYCELNTNQSVSCSFYSAKQRPERNLFISTVTGPKLESNDQTILLDALQNYTGCILNYHSLEPD